MGWYLSVVEVERYKMTAGAFLSGGHVNQGGIWEKYFMTCQIWLLLVSHHQEIFVRLIEMLGIES